MTILVAPALFLLASFSTNIGKLMADLISAIGLQIIFHSTLAGVPCFGFHRRPHS